MKEKTLHEGKMMLCKEMDEIIEKGKLTAGDLENLHKLSDTFKNFLKIEMLEAENEGYDDRGHSRNGGGYSQRGGYSRDGGGYSQGGTWEARGNFDSGHSYDEGGSSYVNRGQHYVRGHYSRDGYSREDDRKEMIGMFEDMMQTASGKDREIIQRAMEEMRRA